MFACSLAHNSLRKCIHFAFTGVDSIHYMVCRIKTNLANRSSTSRVRGAGFARWPIEECQRAAVSNNRDCCCSCGPTAGWEIMATPTTVVHWRSDSTTCHLGLVCWLWGWLSRWLHHMLCSSDCFYVYAVACRDCFVYANWRCPLKWNAYEKAPDFSAFLSFSFFFWFWTVNRSAHAGLVCMSRLHGFTIHWVV